jgi:hypothetical protein
MVTVEEQGPFLESLIYLNQCKNIVEIGVGEAKSTEFMCRGAARTGGHVWGFDVWGTHGLSKQFEHWSTREKCVDFLSQRGHKNFTLEQMDTTTPEFTDYIKEHVPSVDLAFIDGCHSYDGIKNDFDVIYPLLSDTGIIVFHDTMSIDGCREFVIDLRTKFWDGTFDVITFPYGSMVYSDGNVVDRRTGVSLLVKRSFAVITQPCDEICNLEDRTQEIYVKEEEWYEQELARAKQMQNELLTNP